MTSIAEPMGFRTVFVSYNHADAPLVAPIVKLLRINQSLVFQDSDSIRPGKPWRREITDALGRAHTIVVFWCHHASRSEEVSNEWRFGLDHGKDLLPLLLDDTPLPSALAEFQWIDFRSLVGANHSAPPYEHADTARPTDIQQTIAIELKDEILRRLGHQFDEALVAARADGRVRPTSAEFGRLAQEFSQLSDKLMAGGHAADATLALLRSADCLRIMERWDEARPIYQRVIPLAQAASRADYEAKAWLGIGRLENYGARDHSASRQAIDRALALVERSSEHGTLRADTLIELASLESWAGDLDQALATVSEAVTIARAGTDRDLLFNALNNRAGVHYLLTIALFKIYGTLPCVTPDEWQQCQQIERGMRGHFTDAVDDYTHARAIAVELGQPTFANAVQGLLSTMRVIDESQNRTIAFVTQMHELAQKEG